MLVDDHRIVAIVEGEPDVGRRHRVEAAATDLDLEAELEIGEHRLELRRDDADIERRGEVTSREVVRPSRPTSA